VRGTVVARLAGWDLPVDGPASQPIRELLRAFVDVVLSLTEDATDDDELTVACEDRASARSLWGPRVECQQRFQSRIDHPIRPTSRALLARVTAGIVSV